MFLFYAHHIEGNMADFDEVETRHCIQVLRHQTGDRIQFTDGKGKIFTGTIERTGKRSFQAVITASKTIEKFPPIDIHVAIAPTKSIDRFEWFLEKATELGVSQITPIICQNSERKKLRMDRLEKIVLTATKQSFSANLPSINSLTDFADFIDKSATGQSVDRFIAHCRSDDLPHLFHNSLSGKDVVLMIGPEGDFTKEEVEQAESKGFQSVSLGKSRLRTETAGVIAVHTINLKNN